MADNAFDQANLAFDQANTAYSLAQTALIQANTAAGSNKQVQFNDNGILAGNTFFTYDKSTGTLTVKNISVEDDINVINNLNINGDIVPSELGQNIGLPNQRWYNFYIDGGIYANGTFGNPGQILSTDGYGVIRWIDLPSANVDGNTIIYAIDQVARITANNAEELAQAAFNKANTVVSTSIDQYARNTANVAYNNSLVSQAVDNTQNTNITRADTKAQAAFDKANTSYVLAETSNTTATSAVTIAQNAYNKANTASTSAIDQYARNYANVAFYNTEVLAGVDLTQNTQIQSLNTQVQYASATANSAKNDAASASLYANNGITLAQAAFNKSNSITVGVDQYARDTANTATTNIAVQTGVNLTQNTNITRADTKAQAAFDKANTNASNITVVGNYANSGITLAQAAFDKANTGTSTFGVDQYARNTANTSLSTTAYLQNVNNSQNTTITNLTTFAQAAYNQANTQSVSGTTANLAYAKANSANVLAQAAYNQANTAINIATSASVYANTGINNAASASLYANTAINNANSAGQYANNALNLAQNAYDFANTLSGGTATDGWARSRANSAYNQANLAFNSAATASMYALDAFAASENANILANNALETVVFAYNQANTATISASNAQLTATYAYGQANTGTTLAQSAFDRANTKFNSSGGTISGGVNITGNLTVTGETFYANVQQLNVEDNIITLNSNVTGVPSQNAGIEVNRGREQNTSIIWNETNDVWQFTNDGTTYKTIADESNVQSTLNVAQAAFDFANTLVTIGGLTADKIVLSSNTQGQLVSNAVTLTTNTNVTNGLALINQVLGKLVPASPPAFPNSNTLTINSTVGPYRMTNFTQTDHTLTGSKSIAGGSAVSPRRSATYSTNTLNDMGPGDSGVLSVFKNGSNVGGLTLTSSSANGTYGDLIVSDSVDYSVKTGAAGGFWRSFDVSSSGSVSSGWNEVYISHTGAGNTPAVSWYYDSSNPGTPTFTNASIVPLSTSLTYSSTIPHYNSSTTFKLGVDISKLSGDTFPTSNTFFTGSAGGAFQAPASNTYSAVGITYPLSRNLYVSSGSVTVNTTASITTSAFGSSSTGPSVTVDNSYATGSLTYTTALSNTVLFKNGTTSSMEESTVTIGSTIGTGSGSASRIINPGSTDTPSYTSSASLFNSQSSTLQTYDATIVGAVLKHDQTNYSLGYLPPGPNLSSGRSGAQYFTFKFVRTSVSKFDIQFTGTIAGLWVALPGSSIDSTSSLNGWIDMSTAYAGSGVPGAGAGGNGSNGCALGGTVTLNSAVINHRKTCTFGTVSSSSTATNEIYVRIKLTSGQSVSALSLQTASN